MLYVVIISQGDYTQRSTYAAYNDCSGWLPHHLHLDNSSQRIPILLELPSAAVVALSLSSFMEYYYLFVMFSHQYKAQKKLLNLQ